MEGVFNLGGQALGAVGGAIGNVGKALGFGRQATGKRGRGGGLPLLGGLGAAVGLGSAAGGLFWSSSRILFTILANSSWRYSDGRRTTY